MLVYIRNLSEKIEKSKQLQLICFLFPLDKSYSILPTSNSYYSRNYFLYQTQSIPILAEINSHIG